MPWLLAGTGSSAWWPMRGCESSMFPAKRTVSCALCSLILAGVTLVVIIALMSMRIFAVTN